MLRQNFPLQIRGGKGRKNRNWYKTIMKFSEWSWRHSIFLDFEVLYLSA
jgi:hypothetical protein